MADIVSAHLEFDVFPDHNHHRYENGMINRYFHKEQEHRTSYNTHSFGNGDYFGISGDGSYDYGDGNADGQYNKFGNRPYEFGSGSYVYYGNHGVIKKPGF
ncbi:hypothetical protein HNY73_002575 [Argiope bruennichi]|uniref:Uncharacterized protein n=1 Tax=Argiope bruennichi TaxID=94029 RepID=A0A8T0FTY6_ARGBR|nr:hypothetical protein HNY73_002575 [Argiope bruennichi]